MSIHVECGQCFAVMNVSEKHAGKTGQCKSCGAKVKVPLRNEFAAPPPVDDDWATAPPLPRAPRKPPAKPSTRQSGSESQSGLWKRVGGVLGAILLYLVIRTAVRLGAHGVRHGIDKLAAADPAPARVEPHVNPPIGAAAEPAPPVELPHTVLPPAGGRNRPRPAPESISIDDLSGPELAEAADKIRQIKPQPGSGRSEHVAVSPRPKKAFPDGTRALKSGEQLEVGDRVVANWGPKWDVGEVVEVLSKNRAKIHFLRLPEAFDEELNRLQIRIPLPADEIDPALLVTVKFEMSLRGFDDDVDSQLAETELQKAEGYVPGSLQVDQQSRQVSIVVIQDSHAEQFPQIAFGDAFKDIGRQITD